jgi:hypothetical protein
MVRWSIPNGERTIPSTLSRPWGVLIANDAARQPDACGA